jgi:hypothetical protein
MKSIISHQSLQAEKFGQALETETVFLLPVIGFKRIQLGDHSFKNNFSFNVAIINEAII